MLLFALGIAIFAGVLWLDGRMELRLLAGLSCAGAVGALMLGVLILASSPERERLDPRALRHRRVDSGAAPGINGVIGLLVGVLLGAGLLIMCIDALVTGQFLGARRGGAGPTRLSESPWSFTFQFLLYTSAGAALLKLCLPRLLRAWSRGGK